MAYLSHSPHRAYSAGLVRDPEPLAAMLGRCALTAVTVGAAIVALSGAATDAPKDAAKGDRITAPFDRVAEAAAPVSGRAEIMRDAEGRVVYLNEPASASTTVARGATIPLAADSPFRTGK